jgi:hypothetical protein
MATRTTVTFINGYWQLLIGPNRKQAYKSKSKRDCERRRLQILEGRIDPASKLSIEDIDTTLHNLKFLYKKLYKIKLALKK